MTGRSSWISRITSGGAEVADPIKTSPPDIQADIQAFREPLGVLGSVRNTRMKSWHVIALIVGGALLRSIGDAPKAPHWAFQPVRDPVLPVVTHHTWCQTALDRFILARLEADGLTPAAPADRRALCRRATFDLTGLPPSEEEINAFVADASPGAFPRLVDRLLDSPHYGEHWGRHWLDVVRYADTAGETADYPVPVAWRYRNYVIDSLNSDKPYDEFLREQIAGDILARTGPRERYAERVIATGYLAISRRFGFDSENYHHLTIQDTIDTVGQSVLGLSLGCARCHDHKFDPVSMPDYYALYGIFDSTRYAFPGSEQKQKHRAMTPLLPPMESQPKWRDFEARVAALALKLERQKQPVPAAVLRSLDELDGDFEMQAAAAGGSKGVLVPPWVYDGPIAITQDAQSPFKNLYPLGKVGGSVSASTNGYRIAQALHPRRMRGQSGVLHVNLDFRIGTNQAPAPGRHRFWLGAQPASPAVEVLLTAETISVRTGDRVETIRALRTNQWHNLQLTLNLGSGTVSGQIGLPGDVLSFVERPLAASWTGTLDYFAIDSLDEFGVLRPGIAFDNLAVQASPIPPVSTVPPAIAVSPDEPNSGTARKELDALLAAGPFELAYAVSEGTPHNARIQLRGEPDKPGEEVPRGFLKAFGGGPLPKETAGSGRLEFAEWLTSSANPLTARVMVNRIWQYHFGQGLVKTPNDFGMRGQAPTHPELLDHLATQFIRSGWSIKAMHRLILSSAAYQQEGLYSVVSNQYSVISDRSSVISNRSSVGSNQLSVISNQLSVISDQLSVGSGQQSVGGETDARSGGSPSGKIARTTGSRNTDYFSPFPRRRLGAEETRDALLLASGALDPSTGAEHPFPAPTGWGYTQHGPFSAVYDHNRRSVYLMTQRIKRHPFLALFDGPDPNASTAERRTTTVPTQALFFLNDPFVHANAERFAGRLLASGNVEAKQVETAYRLALGRRPTASERAEAAEFLDAYRTEMAAAGKAEPGKSALAAFARVLFGSNEFLTVD